MPLTVPVEIQLFPHSTGGRETPLASGWRSLVSFSEKWTPADADIWPSEGPIPFGSDLVYGCELILAGAKSVSPGESAEGELTLFFLDKPRSAIRRGAEFQLREGARTIGTGQVVG